MVVVSDLNYFRLWTKSYHYIYVLLNNLHSITQQRCGMWNECDYSMRRVYGGYEICA